MKSYGPGGPRGPPPQIPRSTHSRGAPRQSSQGAPFLILKPSIEVTIMLTQPEFPAHRRRDPLRLAELQAYTEFMNSDRAGRVLYEVKTSRNVPELDFAVLLEDMAIYGVQVKGGQHVITRGQWQRITDDGPVTIPCPMKVTWDAALQIREAVKRRLGRKVFVVAVLVFPDMEPDPDIELRAENDRVKVLFGTNNLVERLVDLVADEEIFSPPTAWLVDEIAEALMPFLANGDGDDDQLEMQPDISEPEPNQPEMPERVGNLDVSTRPAEVHHADVVNVYNAPVTINNNAAAPQEDTAEAVVD